MISMSVFCLNMVHTVQASHIYFVVGFVMVKNNFLRASEASEQKNLDLWGRSETNYIL